jgi:hypothetical protein
LKKEFEKSYPQPSEQQDPTYFFEEKPIANLRYLFEGRGISMKGWSTDHVTGYGWNDGTYQLKDFAILLRYAYDDFSESYPPYNGTTPPNECEWFKSQSLLELAALAPQAAPAPDSPMKSH